LATWERKKGTEVPEAGGKVKLENGDTGTVKVWKDVTIESRTTIRPGLIQLEFKTDDPKKASCHNAHWIQFVRTEVYDAQGKAMKVPFQSSGTFKYTGESYVDTQWKEPESVYYDTHGESTHTDTEISIFDRPSALLGPNYSRSVKIFDAFLVVDGKVRWHVHWEQTSTPDKNRVWTSEYTNISGKVAEGMGDFDKPNLQLGYRSKDGDQLSNPVEYSNPVKKR
jgi:hypothetical protein